MYVYAGHHFLAMVLQQFSPVVSLCAEMTSTAKVFIAAITLRGNKICMADVESCVVFRQSPLRVVVFGKDRDGARLGDIENAALKKG